MTTNKKQIMRQRAAMAKIVDEFAVTDRCRVMMACGTGKTRLGMMVAKKIGAEAVLVLVPSVQLVGQTLNAWRTHAKVNGVGFCGPREIAAAKTDDEEGEPFVCVKKDNLRGHRLVVATYQSAKNIEGAPFDLAIYDEGHRAAAKVFGAPLGWRAIKRHLLMTATDKKIGKKDEKFGRCVYRYEFAQAVKDGVIVPLKVRVELSKSLRPGDAKDAPDTHDWCRRAFKDGVKKGQISKAISFHRFVEGAAEFAHSIKGARYVSGEMAKDERAANMAAFESGDCAIIANVACLTEGVDVRAIDAVFFTAKTSSEVKIVQAAGRASRTWDGKECGYVYLPIYVGPGGIDAMPLDQRNTEFKAVARILRHLVESGSLDPMVVQAVANGEVHDSLRINSGAKDAAKVAQRVAREVQGTSDWWDVFHVVATLTEGPHHSTKEGGWVDTQRSNMRGSLNDGTRPLGDEQQIALRALHWWREDYRFDMTPAHDTAVASVDAAGLIGCSVAHVYKYRRENHIVPDDRLDMTPARDALLSHAEAAKAIGCTYGHVRKYRKDNNILAVKGSNQGKYDMSPADDVTISGRDAAILIGCSDTQVCAYRARRGIIAIRKKTASTCGRAVMAIDGGDGVHGPWISAAAASAATGVQRGHISSCAAGKRPRAGGYRWRYADESDTATAEALRDAPLPVRVKSLQSAGILDENERLSVEYRDADAE